MLPLITLEGLQMFKEGELHESLITIIEILYVPKSVTQFSKGSLEILLANIKLVSESVAAFIEHSETRISQKGINNFV